MRLHTLKRGAQRTISFLERANGRRPAEEFLEKFARGAAGGRILATLEQLADGGTVRTPGRLKKLSGQSGLWELRDGQIRIFCFHYERHFVLLQGVTKKSNKLRKNTIRGAIRLRNEFLRHTSRKGGKNGQHPRLGRAGDE